MKKMQDINELEVKKATTKQDNKKETIKTVPNNNYWPIEGLPSKGYFYPEGTEIVGRPLKVMEVKLLSTMTEDNVNYIVNDIIKRAVRGINTPDLLVADKLYIIFWLRANTYKDSGYKVDFTCMKCHKDGHYHFSIDNLETKLLDEKYNEDKEYILPETGDKITLKYQRICDETLMEKFKETNKSNPLIDTEMEGFDDVLNTAVSISTINGEEKSLKDKLNYVVTLAPGDYSMIETTIESLEIGIIPLIKTDCENCGGVTPVGVSFRGNFFIPKYIN